MISNLFFCRPWDDDRHSRRVGAWRVIVSDAVSGNDTRTAAQFHMVVMHRENAAQVSDLYPGISDTVAEEIIGRWESDIRRIVSGHMAWQENAPDSGVVKIWYYEPEEAEPCGFDGTSRLFLRLAVTAINLQPLSDESAEEITQGLLDFLCEAVRSAHNAK